MPSSTARKLRIAVLGLLVNALLALVKLIAGIVGNSYALIADAVESLADIFGSIVVWSGVRIAAAPPDENHPYGHGKAEALASMIVVIFLLGAGIGIAIQAVRQIAEPAGTPALYTLWILLAVIIVKESMYRVARRVGHAESSDVILTDAWHHRSDAITSAAALIGISVAIFAGYPAADAWAALFASAVILFNAFRLSRSPLHELMDKEAPEPGDSIRDIAMQIAGVETVEKLIARRSGGRYLVDMHVEVDPDMSVRHSHAIAHDVKDAVMKAMPSVLDVLVHIEPHAPNNNES